MLDLNNRRVKQKTLRQLTSEDKTLIEDVEVVTSSYGYGSYIYAYPTHAVIYNKPTKRGKTMAYRYKWNEFVILKIYPSASIVLMLCENSFSGKFLFAYDVSSQNKMWGILSQYRNADGSSPPATSPDSTLTEQE